MKAALYHLVLLYSLSSACGEARNRVQASRSWTKPLQPRSIPAISVKRFQKGSRSSRQVVLASFKKAGNIAGDLLSKSGASSILANPGFYYGLREELLTHNAGGVGMTNKLDSAMDELRGMRREISQLKKEMIALRRRLGDNVEDLDEGDGVMVLRKRQREFDQIANEIEKWAENLLFGKGKDEGWQEVNGWNMYNKDGRTKCYLKWMKDSRGKNADQSDSNVYPCLKLYATLDASLDDVCAYLADEKHMKEYNDLVVKHRDLEEISSHSKVCWGQSPQILFIKPRDFVTFCHHRWRRDGSQIVVNQACEHKDAPGVSTESNGQACRAYALRGANFISRHPQDPNKTQFTLVTHANPGGGLPPWLCEKAVKWLCPVEPFKLFHRINENVKRAAPLMEKTEMVTSTPGRTGKAGGLSQMGYACFWPNGGGLKEDARGSFNESSDADKGSPEPAASEEPVQEP